MACIEHSCPNCGHEIADNQPRHMCPICGELMQSLFDEDREPDEPFDDGDLDEEDDEGEAD